MLVTDGGGGCDDEILTVYNSCDDCPGFCVVKFNVGLQSKVKIS